MAVFGFEWKISRTVVCMFWGGMSHMSVEHVGFYGTPRSPTL